MANAAGKGALRFQPATPSRWKDVEALFGERGACAGCWCMWWRLTRSEFAKGKGEGNRRAFRRIVERGDVPGILAYDGTRPVGWCAVAPREEYATLERARSLKRLDDQPVWSVTCFFVEKEWRRRGLSVRLLRAACDHARKRGARIVEGYPVDPRKEYPAAWAWTGLRAAFEKAGFEEAARPSRTRAIMRRAL
jgi:GNAT superfamily N-acetyltransferase